MKKKSAVVLLVAIMICSFLGCGSIKKGDANSGTADKIYLAELKVEDYVELSEYMNVAVNVAPVKEISEEEVEGQTIILYQSQVTADNGGIVDRPVASGDTVIMDYVGKKDGIAFEGGTAQNAELTIGSGRFIDGFEEGLEGVMPGDTVDLNLTFPQNYHNAELAGADVVFTVTLHYIVPTMMEDQVVASMSVEEYQNVDQMKAYVRTLLEEDARNYYDQSVQNAVLEVLLNDSSYKELPGKFLEQCKETVTASVQMQAAAYNMDAETFLYYAAGTDLDTYVSEAGPAHAKQMITLQAIAEKEGLLVSDEALDQYIDEIVAVNGWESREQFLELYDSTEIRENLMCQNVLEFLADNAVVSHQ